MYVKWEVLCMYLMQFEYYMCVVIYLWTFVEDYLVCEIVVCVTVMCVIVVCMIVVYDWIVFVGILVVVNK